MHLTGGTEREEQTNRSTRSNVNLQLALEAEANPKRQFKMIDAWLREYERSNRDWPTLAKMCHEVKVKGLWKHGGYKDWSHWVLAAAPSRASLGRNHQRIPNLFLPACFLI